MQPGSNDVHVNRRLTNLSIGYQNLEYISDQIFPVLLVSFRSDLITLYDKSYWFRDEAQELSATEPPPLGGYEIQTTDYFCRKYGMGTLVADDVRANTDAPLSLDVEAMEFVVDKLDMRGERKFVEDFWKTTVWGADKTGDTDFTKWSTYGTSTPIINMRSWKREIRRKIGREPNQLVLGDLTYDALADHPAILDRIKFSASSAAPAIVDLNLLAQLFGIGQVLVGNSIYTASAEGTAEGSVVYTPSWDDDALLHYRATRPSLRTPSSGYLVVWRTAFGGRRFIRKRREPRGELADLIEGFEFFVYKQTAADAGIFMSDCAD